MRPEDDTKARRQDKTKGANMSVLLLCNPSKWIMVGVLKSPQT